MPSAYYIVDFTATGQNTAVKDIIFDPDYKQANFSNASADFLKNIYIERITDRKDLIWEGLVWNVLCGTNPAPLSPAKKFPPSTGPVYLQFYIPVGTTAGTAYNKVTGAVAAQFVVSQYQLSIFPVQSNQSRTVAVATALTNILWGNKQSSVLIPGIGSFVVQYIIVIG